MEVDYIIVIVIIIIFFLFVIPFLLVLYYLRKRMTLKQKEKQAEQKNRDSILAQMEMITAGIDQNLRLGTPARPSTPVSPTSSTNSRNSGSSVHQTPRSVHQTPRQAGHFFPEAEMAYRDEDFKYRPQNYGHERYQPNDYRSQSFQDTRTTRPVPSPRPSPRFHDANEFRQHSHNSYHDQRIDYRTTETITNYQRQSPHDYEMQRQSFEVPYGYDPYEKRESDYSVDSNMTQNVPMARKFEFFPPQRQDVHVQQPRQQLNAQELHRRESARLHKNHQRREHERMHAEWVRRELEDESPRSQDAYFSSMAQEAERKQSFIVE